MIRIIFLFARIYWFFRRPLTRGVLLMNAFDNKVLLVKHTYGKDQWYFPGGHMKRHEEFQYALAREIKKELKVNLDKSKMKLRGVFLSKQNFKNDLIVLFLYIEDLELSSKNFDREIKEGKYFDIDDLPADINKGVRRRIEEYKNNNYPIASQW